MITNRKIVETEDGSASLFDERTGEHYHSIHGAIAESELVFIKNGLQSVIENKDSISILEMGFGTGLNAILTLRTLEEEQICCHYTTIEAYPLEKETFTKLNYCNNDSLKNYSDEFLKLHEAEWSKMEKITNRFSLSKINSNMLDYEPEAKSFDLIYFDAFSPNVQAELWSVEMFQKLNKSLNSDGVLVTYCAKGVVKQALRNSGFDVKRLHGPIGKRHVLRCKNVSTF